MNKYTVQKGDTLAAIGRKYGVSYMDIAKENNISNPDQIYEGQTLQISMPANTGSNTSGRADTVTPATTINKGTAPAAKPVTSPGGVTYGDFSYADFNPMDDPVIQQAYAALEQHNANKPGAWVDPYQSQYMGFLNQYENRDPFSYDFNSDALYQQYKDSYIQQGQMAMMDTMGQAAAMTGGYGNSYAQTVGQQAYNQQLGQLNDIMPELYGMAYDRYQQEGQEMLNMYDRYKGLSDQSFDRHQVEQDNWYREDARLTDNYNTLYDREHDDWERGYNTALEEYLTGRNEKFTADENEKNRVESNRANAKSDLINLITATGYEPTDSELASAGMTREQAKGYAKAYSDSKTGGTSDYSDLDYDTQQKWSKEANKAGKTWSGLTSVWNRMKISEHNPMSSAEFILDYALNNGITPTAADLDSFQTKLEREGLTNDEAAAFIGEWAMAFGLIGLKQPSQNPTTTGGGGGGRHMWDQK